MKNKVRYIKLGALFVVILSLTLAYWEEKQDYKEVAYRLENLEDAYNQLLIETEGWRELSDLERESMLIKLSEGEEEALEESFNQEDVLVLEDDKLEGYVSLQELLLEPEKYHGEFIKISSELRPSMNNVERKSFSTALATGSKSWENDISFRLEVFYRELENWKDFGMMKLERDANIRVEGTFYLYANEYNRGYLEASKITFVN